MNKLLPIASLLLAAGALQAQATSMTVTGKSTAAANKIVKDLATGAVKSYARVSVRDGKSWWRPDASASKSVRHYVSRYSGSSYASVSDFASARVGTNTASVGGKGTIDVVIKAGKKGSLVLTYYGRGKAALSVSGAAAWTPLVNGKKQTKTVAISKAGDIKFSVSSSASATATAKVSAYASNSLSVVFIPDFNATKCTISAGTVKGCTGGGALTGSSALSSRRHVITLKLTGAKASSWFINLIGAADKGNAMANKCLLLDKPMWAGFGRTDSKGNGTSRFSVSATKAMSAWMQSAVINFGTGFSLNTSNTLGIVCK